MIFDMFYGICLFLFQPKTNECAPNGCVFTYLLLNCLSSFFFPIVHSICMHPLRPKTSLPDFGTSSEISMKTYALHLHFMITMANLWIQLNVWMEHWMNALIVFALIMLIFGVRLSAQIYLFDDAWRLFCGSDRHLSRNKCTTHSIPITNGSGNVGISHIYS